MKKCFSVGALTLMMSMIGCSSAPSTSANSQIVDMDGARLVVKDPKASYIKEISFEKGSSHLSTDAKSDLQKLLTEAEAAGSVEQIRVITWADAEYPSMKDKKLDKDSRELVRERNEEIKDYLTQRPEKLKVKTHSMAVRPGNWKEWLETSDARIKDTLEAAGIPTDDTATSAPAKSSKSVILVMLK